VWCVNFHREGGIYRGEWDLHRLGEVGLLTWRGWFGTRWWSGGQATRPAGRVERPPQTFSTDLSFSSSRRHMATKAQPEPPQTLPGRPRSWADRPVPRPTRPEVWPTQSMCQIHPHGDDDFDIWSTSLCHPLKYSNLVPKFQKTNKH
jgi:hypothetical protein